LGCSGSTIKFSKKFLEFIDTWDDWPQDDQLQGFIAMAKNVAAAFGSSRLSIHHGFCQRCHAICWLLFGKSIIWVSKLLTQNGLLNHYYYIIMARVFLSWVH
jgi:hypothetical protein